MRAAVQLENLITEVLYSDAESCYPDLLDDLDLGRRESARLAFEGELAQAR
jgi:hypothetical protein